jgi:UDP-glucose 4-epimerase
MHLNGAKVVVTGGAGFIGSYVVERLSEAGAEAVAIDDLSVGTKENLADAMAQGARLVVGSVLDDDVLDAELADADLVIHMAAENLRASLSKPLESHHTNATGTLKTCLASVRNNVTRFVYVSSSEAYGSGETELMDEDHPLLPTTVYGAAKAAAELYAQSCQRRYGIPVTVIRPFNSYGPRAHAVGGSAEVIPKFATRLLAGKSPVIFGDGSQTRDFTWVEETAAGIVMASASDDLVGGAVNIARGENVSIRDIAMHLTDIIQPEGHVKPEYDYSRPGDVRHHHADTTRARDILGYQPQVDVRVGLERYVEWLRAGGNRGLVAEGARNW